MIVQRCDEKKADILGFGVTATSLSNPKHVAHDALARLRDVLYYCPRSLHIANSYFFEYQGYDKSAIRFLKKLMTTEFYWNVSRIQTC